MVKHSYVPIAIFLALFAIGCGDQAIQSPPKQLSKTTSSSQRIPFLLTDSNNISVPATVNDSEQLNLMFHTAEDTVTLTEAAVEKMKSIVLTDSVEAQSWGGTSTSKFSKGNRLKIGELEFANQIIFVDKLSGPGTDGKFGPNQFGSKIIEIQFDTRELWIHESLPMKALEANSTYTRLDFTNSHGSMYVTGELNVGDRKLTNSFMVHSGFGGTALLDDQFVETNELGSKLETLSQRELKDSFGNVLKTKKVKIASLRFGELSFSDVPVEIFDGAIGMQKMSVLGGELLKRFNIIIDSANSHLYLSPSQAFGSAFRG